MLKSSLSCASAFAIAVSIGCSEPKLNSGERVVADKSASTDEVAVVTDSKPIAKSDANTTASRKFTFDYDVVISGLKPGANARVWLPKAQSSHDQVVHEAKLLAPREAKETVEERFGNRLLYFEAVANAKGEIPVHVQYVIERHEARIDDAEKVADGSNATFLTGSKLAPADGSILKAVFEGAAPKHETPLAIARALYDKVDERMTYGKPEDKAWGRGDAFFACQEGVGNCTDFHSMFISLARDLKVPAKFEIGFPLPPQDKATKGDIGGYHCWAKFAADGRWIGVDISEADKHPEMKKYYFGNLTPDRVTFTTGRDLKLVPANDAGPVNFLVYPYVEIEGKQHTGLVKQFRFADVE